MLEGGVPGAEARGRRACQRKARAAHLPLGFPATPQRSVASSPMEAYPRGGRAFGRAPFSEARPTRGSSTALTSRGELVSPSRTAAEGVSVGTAKALEVSGSSPFTRGPRHRQSVRELAVAHPCYRGCLRAKRACATRRVSTTEQATADLPDSHGRPAGRARGQAHHVRRS